MVRKLRLFVTDHALVRMADWHPEFRQFVPKHTTLDYSAAQGVMNALHVFVASLEKGRPATKVESVLRQNFEKYGHATQLYIFDRPLLDIYTLIPHNNLLTLVTVTAIQKRFAHTVLDDPKPPCRFEEVCEIQVPYLLLDSALHGEPELQSIRTPAGRSLPIIWHLTDRRTNTSRFEAPAREGEVP